MTISRKMGALLTAYLVAILLVYAIAAQGISAASEGILHVPRVGSGGEFKGIQDALETALLNLNIALLVLVPVIATGGILILRTVVKPLRNLESAIRITAESLDFTQPVPVGTTDEIGRGLHWYSALIEKLRTSFVGIHTLVDHLREESEAVDHSSRQIARNSQLQSNASSNMASAMEKMTASIATAAEQAGDASKHAKESREVAVQSVGVIQGTVAAIEEISVTVGEASIRIKALHEDCGRISSMAVIIQEIANQTNLLALNAAIEAAHAGEHGRGFGVVADEVRKLSERTTQSTREINVLLNAMQESAASAKEIMQRTEIAVSLGVGNAREAGVAIEQLKAEAVAVARVVAEISEAMKVQQAASSALAHNIEQIADMSEQNSRAAVESAAGAGRMTQVGFEMANGLGAYKVESGPTKITLRAAFPNSEDHPAVRAVRAMADLLAQRTQGRITLKTFAGGSFGVEKETLEQVKVGTLDMARGNVALLAKEIPAALVPALPYLFDSAEHMHKAMEGAPGQEILDSCMQAGYVGLAVYDVSARSVYSNKPIRSLADMRGEKLRIMQSDLWVEIAKAMGATPTPLAQDQVTAASKTGLIDCAENSIVVFNGYQHYGVFKFFCETEHAMVPEILLFSKKRWETLGEEDRAIISLAAKDSLPIMRGFHRESEMAAQRKAIEAGTIFVKDVDKAAFKAAMRPIYEKFVLTSQQEALVQAINAIR